jgi:flavin-dependent dehydrogenase
MEEKLERYYQEMKEHIMACDLRWNQHERRFSDINQKYDTIISECKEQTEKLDEQTEKLDTLVENTRDLVKFQTDLKGTKNMAERIQKLGIWLLKWPASLAAIIYALNWLLSIEIIR